MATLLVSDTSVLIDLHRGGLLDAIFRLQFEIGVPDLLFERELKTWDGPRLQALGLKVLVLDGVGVELAQRYRRHEPRLSTPDAFALALAKTGGHILLAGDASLRVMAEVEHVECHGVLWVIDALGEQGVLGPDQLLDGLTQITAHPRCRLPPGECQRRLEHYRRASRAARAGSSE